MVHFLLSEKAIVETSSLTVCSCPLIPQRQFIRQEGVTPKYLPTAFAAWFIKHAVFEQLWVVTNLNPSQWMTMTTISWKLFNIFHYFKLKPLILLDHQVLSSVRSFWRIYFVTLATRYPGAFYNSANTMNKRRRRGEMQYWCVSHVTKTM